MKDEFNCCGGNDETPKQHTMDCPDHPPECQRCGQVNGTETVPGPNGSEQWCPRCVAAGLVLTAKELAERRAQAKRRRGGR